MVEILEVKLAGDPGQELFGNRNELAKEYSQIRTECVELVRIFYTLNTDDDITRDFQHKLDPTLYKDITATIDQAIQSIRPDSLDAARDVLLKLRKHVLKINYLRLSTMEPFLSDLAKVQSAHDRKLVKITFDWDTVLVPPELARPLRDVFAVLIEKSIGGGLETPARRRKLGKAEYGHIRIKAVADEQGVLFHLSDDGRGISAGKLREIMKEKGILTEAILQKMTDEQIFQQVFASSLLHKEKPDNGPIVDFSGLKRFFDEYKASDIRLTSQLGLGLMLQFRLKSDTEVV
jgi:chemotaxis protein histidine kinase CheA